ncbi:MAG: DMT family transporter [Leptolyngbyaceae cyanobacterium]
MTMLAFAANSLLCREALASDSISAGSFTLVRVAAGALVLALLSIENIRQRRMAGSWWGATALMGYAAAFSFAYNSLSAGTGALILFGAVQATMIGYGLCSGERLNTGQLVGVVAACGGLVWLLLPGVQSPSLAGAALMAGAGICWGVYSLLGRGTQSPTAATAGNFIRALPIAVALFLLTAQSEHTTSIGLVYAAASGALASGMGYALWYLVLPSLSATTAAMVQLSVPVIAASGGMVLLSEAVTARFVCAGITVLGGIATFVVNKGRASGL